MSHFIQNSPTPAGSPLAGRPHYKWELLALLCCAFFFHQGDRAIYGVVLPSVKVDLALTDSQLGLVGTVLFGMLALMMPVAGYVGDFFNRRWIIICSLFFWSGATMLTGFAGGLATLIAFRSVATAGGESFYAPAAYPLLASHHVRTRALALSIHQAALYLGVMVSGFIGGYVAERWGWRSAFYVFGGGGVLLGFVLLWRLVDTPAERVDRVTAPEPPWRALGVVFRTPSALLLTAGFAAVVFVNNAYVVWSPVFLQERFGLSLTRAGGYAMFFHHLAALIGILLGGWWSDRRTLAHPAFRPKLMAMAMLLGAPAIYFMGQATSLTAVCAFIAAFGLFRGLYEANTHAALFQVVPPRQRASAVGIMSMLAFLIGSLSPWLMGRMREHGLPKEGLAQGFSTISCAYLLGSVALFVVASVTFGRDRISEEPPTDSAA
jgi:MFS family permease